MDELPEGRLDVAVLDTLARRALSHPLVATWAYVPNARSPRSLAIDLDVMAYPAVVTAVRIDARWFDNDDHSFHYVETHDDGRWQCRWDRHSKPDAPEEHFHRPSNASEMTASKLSVSHYSDALFSVPDWIGGRVTELYENG